MTPTACGGAEKERNPEAKGPVCVGAEGGRLGGRAGAPAVGPAPRAPGVAGEGTRTLPVTGHRLGTEGKQAQAVGRQPPMALLTLG